MKLTYSNQTIDLFSKDLFPELPRKIVISLSGGLDSSSLTYLVATYFPDIEIYPFHSRDIDGPLDTECALNVHKFLQNYSSQVKNLTIFDVNTSDPIWLKKAQEELDSPKGKINGVPKWRTVRGGSKALQNRNARRVMYDRHKTIVAYAMSMNPPIEDMKRLGFYDVAERKRDPGRSTERLLDNGIYSPYLNVYPMTKSCAWGPESGNTNYPEPCGKCFWCNEKAWAF